jgi:hypothetical protein
MVTEVVVSEVAATAIASAITAQTAAMKLIAFGEAVQNEQLYGSTAKFVSKGGTTAQAANIVLALNDIRDYVKAQADSAKSLETAMGTLAKSIDTQTKALQKMEYIEIQKLNTATLALVDQMEANKHDQKVVADSREEQGKPPIDVTDKDKVATMKKNIVAAGDLKQQVLIGGAIEGYITDAFLYGKTMSLKLFAESGIEEWFTDQWGKIKAQSALLFTTKKTKEATISAQRSIESTKNDPTTVFAPPTYEA